MPVAPLVTPEAVPIELRPAGIASRFLALALDWAVQSVLALAVVLGLTAFLDETSRGVGLAALFILGSLVIFGYPVILETLWRGRTPGKAALGLRVVTVEGGQVRLRHALIRAALGVIDFAVTTGGAAVVSALVTRDTRRLGDLAAGTLVLRERSGLRAPTAVRFAPPPGLEAFTAGLDVSAVTPQDYLVLRAFLLRAAALPAAARYQLAVSVATPLAARVRPAPPAGSDPLTFLACVAAAYQAGHAAVGAAAERPTVVPPVTVPAPGAAAAPAAPADDAGGFQAMS